MSYEECCFTNDLKENYLEKCSAANSPLDCLNVGWLDYVPGVVLHYINDYLVAVDKIHNGFEPWETSGHVLNISNCQLFTSNGDYLWHVVRQFWRNRIILKAFCLLYRLINSVIIILLGKKNIESKV
jgi:hypothetical protein